MQTKSDYKIRIEKSFDRVLRKTSRSLFSILKSRPSSYPFVTGDSFRSLANHIFDETTPDFKPEDVKLGDIVFVGSPNLRTFLKEYHLRIINKYILIVHNGDDQVEADIIPYLDDTIYRLYAQCAMVTHEKITPIPIGVENLHHGNSFSWLLKIKPLSTKLNRIFYHFSVETNPNERIPAKTYFQKHPLFDTITSFIPNRPYKNLLNSYAFTASPAGNTLGSHRTWEALYLRTIPIVKSTPDAEACVANGLPLWIINDWNDLEEFTEDKLGKKYTELISKANFDSLYMDYWIKRIKSDQEIIRAEHGTN